MQFCSWYCKRSLAAAQVRWPTHGGQANTVGVHLGLCKGSWNMAPFAGTTLEQRFHCLSAVSFLSHSFPAVSLAPSSPITEPLPKRILKALGTCRTFLWGVSLGLGNPSTSTSAKHAHAPAHDALHDLGSTAGAARLHKKRHAPSRQRQRAYTLRAGSCKQCARKVPGRSIGHMSRGHAPSWLRQRAHEQRARTILATASAAATNWSSLSLVHPDTRAPSTIPA